MYVLISKARQTSINQLTFDKLIFLIENTDRALNRTPGPSSILKTMLVWRKIMNSSANSKSKSTFKQIQVYI
jgi:hypothetical protein